MWGMPGYSVPELTDFLEKGDMLMGGSGSSKEQTAYLLERDNSPTMDSSREFTASDSPLNTFGAMDEALSANPLIRRENKEHELVDIEKV